MNGHNPWSNIIARNAHPPSAIEHFAQAAEAASHPSARERYEEIPLPPSEINESVAVEIERDQVKYGGEMPPHTVHYHPV